MRWSLALAAGCVFFVSSPVLAKEITIHGFVTDVKSPTSFAIDDYKVTRDNARVVELDTRETDKSLATFKPEDIRVGTELEIKGEYDDASGELKANSIKVFFEDTRSVRRTALIEKIPSLTREGSGWKGEIHADGQRITVSPTTSITLKPNKFELRNLGNAKEEPRRFEADFARFAEPGYVHALRRDS